MDTPPPDAAADPLDQDGLDAVKEFIKNSSFTRSRTTSYKIPPIQEGHHCVFIDGNESLQQPFPNESWSISKIPPHVREIDDNAYTPRLVSVGPLHYNKTDLEFMEVQKQRFLVRLKERCSRLQLDKLKDYARELEQETRKFYSDNFNLIDSNSFVKMMILDGCFVIEFLRLGVRSCQGKLADDPIFATHWMPLNLGQDLLLLENQLPLTLLKGFFDLTKSDDENDSLVYLALQFFKTISPGKDAAETSESHDTNDNSPHLLALFHSSFTPKGDFQLPAQEGNTCKHIMYAGKGWINGATILNSSGIKFKPKPGTILDLEFNEKELNIPPIFIDHTRASILRNLVAYEQQDKRAIQYFTSLVVFFSNILCNTDDARILMKSGIIRQAENNEEEIVKFFNSIVQDLVFDMNRCYLHKLIEDVNCTSQTVWEKIRPFFWHIPHPKFIEIILFLLSLVPTLEAVKRYLEK